MVKKSRGLEIQSSINERMTSEFYVHGFVPCEKYGYLFFIFCTFLIPQLQVLGKTLQALQDMTFMRLATTVEEEKSRLDFTSQIISKEKKVLS